MSQRNFRGGFSQKIQRAGLSDARQKLIRGRIQDARQILNKKAQLRTLGLNRTKIQRVNSGRKQFTVPIQNRRFGINRAAVIGKIHNRQNAVTKNMRMKMKNDAVFQRRFTGTEVHVRQGKQIKVRGGSILVTAKQPTPAFRLQQESNDELEEMTLDDIPNFSQVTSVQSLANLPHGAITPPARMLATAPVTSSSAYTVLVSNLHPSVTEEDIKELFGAVGTIVSTKFLHPGAALVSYFGKADAVNACTSYHNRLLDGQPMQCSLLSQADQQKGRSSIASRLGGRLSQNANNNFARVALSHYIPSASTQMGGLAFTSRDPIFNVRLS